MPRSIIQETESEYGLPFWEVVRGFAEDGHSVHATALLLGYSSDTPFRRLIKRHGVTIEFAGAQESVFQTEARESRRGRATPALLAACKIASAHNPVYKRIHYAGQVDTLAGHAKRHGVSVSTARKRYLRNPDPEYVFAPRYHWKNPPKGMGWQNEARLSSQG